MDPHELKEIMSQGAIRPETPRDRAEQRVLEEDLADSPVTGKPLRRRLRNFQPDADAGIMALGGPTAWMRRLRAIEDEIARHEEQLAIAYEDMQAGVDPKDFPRLWHELAYTWRFDAVNELIDQHNRFFPAEARLAMNPKTRDFVEIGGRPYRREPLDAVWILRRWPA
jgi:hypothetical protein